MMSPFSLWKHYHKVFSKYLLNEKCFGLTQQSIESKLDIMENKTHSRDKRKFTTRNSEVHKFKC